ncbi:hypothetical protein TNCV_3280201 [Trichonephila clavipes]|nr:hypothetical protein TNCV_3280201 [Trichonephila clavipes]
MWSKVARQLTHITSPAATPDQLWQRFDAACSAVPQERIRRLFEEAWGSGDLQQWQLLILAGTTLHKSPLI